MTRAPILYRCSSCGRDDITEPAGHENRRHDGAQTCWPYCRICDGGLDRGTPIGGQPAPWVHADRTADHEADPATAPK